MWGVLIVPLFALSVLAIRFLRIPVIWLACGLGLTIAFAVLSYSDIAGLVAGEFGIVEYGQRMLFRILSVPDFPVMQLGLAFSVNWFLSRRFSRNDRVQPVATESSGKISDHQSEPDSTATIVPSQTQHEERENEVAV